MSWADSMRATALAALAERETTICRIFSGDAAGWFPQDVWLSRAKQTRPRSRAATPRDPAAPVRRLNSRTG